MKDATRGHLIAGRECILKYPEELGNEFNAENLAYIEGRLAELENNE
jgi:hypothetical protein